jgi:hypothetical protein
MVWQGPSRKAGRIHSAWQRQSRAAIIALSVSFIMASCEATIRWGVEVEDGPDI